MSEEKRTDKTIVVFSADLDKVMAAFNIAIGAASMGFECSMYFTFWGLNVLRKENAEAPVKKKDFMSKMLGVMMPKGPKKLTLSQMNMGGMGTSMMKMRMKSKNIMQLPELIKMAHSMGVKFLACQMTMNMMGMEKDEFIDDLSYVGVAGYLGAVEKADCNLFI